MKNILVPTDFSDHAEYATQAAIKMAAKFGATVHVLNCLVVPQWNILNASQEEKTKFESSMEMVQDVERKFQDLKNGALNQEVVIKTSWINARVVPSISSYIDSENIDCIIMGAHGTNQNYQSILGSITQNVVGRVKCPVFIIKSPIKNIELSNVVYASGFDGSEREGFEIFFHLSDLSIPM